MFTEHLLWPDTVPGSWHTPEMKQGSPPPWSLNSGQETLRELSEKHGWAVLWESRAQVGGGGGRQRCLHRRRGAREGTDRRGQQRDPDAEPARRFLSKPRVLRSSPKKLSMRFLCGTPRPPPAPSQGRCPTGMSFSMETLSCRKQGPLDSTPLCFSLHGQIPVPREPGSEPPSKRARLHSLGSALLSLLDPLFSLTSLFLSKPHTSGPDGLSHHLPTCPTDTGPGGSRKDS